ncbi:MAG TPA: hypothetical protein VMZ71_05035, partial [Gemmataceae bacterium]|nr:hypothetical protein [Gemmataceae bacterium]
MTEAEWLASTDPLAMLDHLGPWVADRKRMLFACACFRASPYRGVAAMKAALQEVERAADIDPYLPPSRVNLDLTGHTQEEFAALGTAWLFRTLRAEDAAYHAFAAMTGFADVDAIFIPECFEQCAQ